MEKSPSWEANRFSTSQEIPRILWNPKVHYRIHKCRNLFLSWASSIQSMPPHLPSLRAIKAVLHYLNPLLTSALLSQIWSMYLFRNKWDGVIKERESVRQQILTWTNHASSEPTEQIRHINYLAKIEENFHHSLHFITWGVWGKRKSIQEMLRGLESVCWAVSSFRWELLSRTHYVYEIILLVEYLVKYSPYLID